MRILAKMKDGGPESKVWGFWLIEIKSLFSIVLLKFEDGSREAYHNHAFNAISWILTGKLLERHLGDIPENYLVPSFWPVVTKRNCFHKVTSIGTTWAISFRGPWNNYWNEYTQENGVITLTNGRKEV